MSAPPPSTVRNVTRWALLIGVIALAGVGALVLRWRNNETLGGRDFANEAACGTCHAAEQAAWTRSQHAKAMEPASTTSVRAPFDSTTVIVAGHRYQFYRKNDRFYVNTLAEGATSNEYEITHAFGLEPLQQYLVAMSRGRLQPLSLAWDTRDRTSGGQRWYTLDPRDSLAPGDELHWAGRELNWNHMCADCHATGVRKGYLARSDSFVTRYASTGVTCQACHGPAAAHLAWSKTPGIVRRVLWASNGVRANGRSRARTPWVIDSATGNARPQVGPRRDAELAVCAQCHARRAHIADGYVAGDHLLDYYDPLPLTAELYYSDGQQRDEVYNYGSFLQSRMYAAGVSCSSCHEPHSQKLRLPGNAVCAQCHLSTKYDGPQHHHHAVGSAGAQCATCHMPTTTYLEIDQRHDHSIRIPRPDRSATLGTPNVCQSCHERKGAVWAVEAIRRWRNGAPKLGYQTFAESFARVDHGERNVADTLVRIAINHDQPSIVRAGALYRLGIRALTASELAALRTTASDEAPLVRRGVLYAMRATEPQLSRDVITPLLSDSLRAIRIEAARQLATLADSLFAPATRQARVRAEAEYVESQQYNGDRLEHLNALGAFWNNKQERAKALDVFVRAVRLYPRNVSARLNVAGMRSLLGAEPQAEEELRAGINVVPDSPDLYLALGQSLVRQRRVDEAIAPLTKAFELGEASSEFALPLAVVLESIGRLRGAVGILKRAVNRGGDPRVEALLREYSGRTENAKATRSR